MRGICYTLCFVAAILVFGSCNKTDLYEQKEKTLDSLGGAINSMLQELKNVDTLSLQTSLTRFNWYNGFIQENVHDTITKDEADNLRHFFVSGKDLENFSDNRKLILKRASLINIQLQKLSLDIKNKSLSPVQVSSYTHSEITESTKLIEMGYGQQKLFHSRLEEFKNSLKEVELLIRSRNKGELPTIIKDTISL